MKQTRQKRTTTVILTSLLSVIMVLAMIFAIRPATTLPAHAEGETIEIYTNTKQWSYSSGCVTITVNDTGDGDGAKVDENRLMAISVSGNVVIKNAKVRIGYYYQEAEDVRSDVCDEINVEGSGNHNTYVTFSNVNAKKITVSTTFDMVQIDHVSLELIPVNGVTYELNGGSFNGEYIDYYFDHQGLTLPTNAVKSHYNFLGWYDNVELTGNAVTAIGADETGSKTFWAKWELTKNNITYNTNEGEWNGEYPTTYQETIGLTLPTNVTKPHFTFAGWYSNAEFDGEAVTEITDEDSGDKEYWAKWEQITHNITYHLNGGEWEGGISAPTSFNEGEIFELVGPDSIFPVKTGYVFYGWYTSSTLDEESYIQIIQADETNDVEVWAEWGLPPAAPTIEDIFPTAGKTEHIGEVATVTATANENGFVLDKTHSITITIEEGLFPDDGIYLVVADGYEYNPQPEYITSEYEYSEQFITTSWGDVYHGGYSLDGINILSGPIIFAPFPFDFEAFDGSITVTLNDEYSEKSLAFKQIHFFTHHVRTITYNANGGIMPGDCPTNYLESRGLELPVPIRNGYIFKGWCDNKELEGEAVTKITVADTGDKVFYAKWEFIEVVDLSELTEDVTIYDGQTITGELQNNVKVTIADGATVTLKDVIIEGEDNHAYAFAGITLEGDATLILEGNNTVTGFEDKYPGIYVPENKTITIGGNGTLDVSSNGYAAGIGAGFDVPCGNIVIEGGTINAIGGSNSAGIGAGNNLGSCGTITIKGGVVSATGGDGGAGIGGGEGSDCGDITITNKAKKVTAVSGSDAPNSIGSGRNGNAVRVTIAGEVYEEGISGHDFVYTSATAEEFAAFIEDLGTVEYSDEYKEKLEQAREMYNYLSDEEKEKVDAATLKVLTDAEAEYKNLEDGAKADETTDVIDNLPNDITIDDKEAIEAARTAYEALTDDQKAKVDHETLAKLEAAEKEINDIETSNQVTETINNLPSIDEITLADKDAIETARAAYEDLSDEAKKMISKETIDNLEDAELALAIAIFDEEFDKVPASADQITHSDKEAIEAARAAYEALSDEQKSQFPQDKLDKLEEAETALAYVTFNEEIAKIPANSDDITVADKEAIEAARAAYEALTDEQKSKFPQDKLDKLEEAESALVVITVSETIDALPSSEEITTANKEAIEAARAAYEALTDEEKAKVAPEMLAKIEAAESVLAISMTKESIDALPSSDEITTANKEAIEAARAAYDTLTDEEKAKVAPEMLAKLEEAESALAVITVSETIDALPSFEEITTADKEAIEAARAAYEALTDDQKAKVDHETLTKLEEAEKEINDIETSNQVTEAINNLPSSDEITTADKEAIEAARAAYEALTDEQKAMIKAEDLQTLVNAEKAYDNLVNPKSQAPVALLVVVCILLIPALLMLAYLILYITKKKGSTVMSVVGLPVVLTVTSTTGAFVALYVLIGLLVAVVVADVIIAIKNPQAIKDIKNFKQLFKKDAKNDSAATETAPITKQEQPTFGEDEEEVVTVTDENGNIFNIRFIKSFTAKLIQSPEETKKYYEELKNFVLSYKKTTSRVSWNYDSINSGRNPVLKFAIRGKTLCVYLPLDADKLEDKYKVEIVESKKYEDVPCLYRIKNDRRLGYVKELIAMVCERLGLVQGEEQHESYANLPYEENKPLIARGLIKEQRVQVNKPAEVVLESHTDAEGDKIVTTKDSSGNIFEIRFIKSFTAKLSQASDEVKNYYNIIKNHVLSYQKANSRISWHYDSINVGREQAMKFAIRGKTLCVYYALDEVDEKYKVEKVESKKYEDVPCLYRIKNDRRCAYAKELVDILMKKLHVSLGKESNEDFSVPFEETKALLAKGLIKEVKTKVNAPVEEHFESITVAKADEMMSDEKAEAAIEEDTVSKKREGKKVVVNIDTLSQNYKDGDTVTLDSLIEKKLVSSNTGYVKVLARGILDKKLTVELHDYSIQAVKMIVLMGGHAKKIK